MERPSLSIALMNGGLNLIAPSEFGTTGLLIASPIAPVAGYGVPFLVKSKDQVKTAFAQVGNEAVSSALQDYIFGEAPAGTKVYIMCMANTTTLATMASAANAEKVLNMGAGAIRRLGAIKFPANDYTPTITNGFDVDVHNAVTAFQTLANAWLLKKMPFRYFVEGFAFADTATAKDYSATTNRNGFIVASNIDGSTAKATLLALGRAAAIAPQRNIGRGKDASLNIPDAAVVKVGAIVADLMTDTDLDTLWDKRYITIIRNPSASGYIFSDDPALTATTDDYNNLRYGSVMDNITRRAFVTYAKELKDDVDVNEGGRMDTVVEKALAGEIKNDIGLNLAGQLSTDKGEPAVTCLVNPDPELYRDLYEKNGIDTATLNFNLLQTGKVYIFVLSRPKGSIGTLSVFLGYTAN